MFSAGQTGVLYTPLDRYFSALPCAGKTVTLLSVTPNRHKANESPYRERPGAVFSKTETRRRSYGAGQFRLTERKKNITHLPRDETAQ